ncbi:NADH:flavin oxidoreductase/NADH oxidase [Raineyella sp. LH-20]|uniref:NADH:flavin oxidoreductase/NADH oxidase n=1 Tax=Raineyella sp. LH-20 TaxID=3081204 RepID=UPI0029550410|nr:NADH:flavin oxidoreductase/NADH oxidase [Raineyella sp. LH-20]WOP19041.1 NADH:flavin oxidoreductase/NADH oxidase [Raineyella sp. LH-20]
MSQLFTPLTLRGTTVPNRVWMSPMCMYSAAPSGASAGCPTDFHLQHLASRAGGGAGLVLVESTGVLPVGRISPWDLGLWNDAQADAFAPIVDLCHRLGAAVGIQLNHAGRKAGTRQPWAGVGTLSARDGGWTPVAPSAVAFDEHHATPRAMTAADIVSVIEGFRSAARRALEAGFDTVEIHGAHGYLLHQFCSPLSNRRTDDWGGSFEGRVRLPLAVVDAVREEVGPDVPVLYRVSATDWFTENGIEGDSWTLEQTRTFARLLEQHGVDLIDVSTGGVSPLSRPTTVGPGYQVRFAASVREVVGIPVSTVGIIVDADQAEEVLVEGRADAVMVARELLRDPYAPARWEAHLDGGPTRFPVQYTRALPFR